MPSDTEKQSGRRLWNSLEVAKLAVGLAFPLALLILSNNFVKREDSLKHGQELTKTKDEHDRTQVDERERREVDRKFSVWEQMAPEINAIYSYFLYVGDWRTIPPKEIIHKKRLLDGWIYSNRIFFNKAFFDAYTDFIKAAFSTYQGWDQDPMLNTVRIRDFDKTSHMMFATCDNADAVYEAYWAFQVASARELDLPTADASPRPQMQPGAALAPPCINGHIQPDR